MNNVRIGSPLLLSNLLNISIGAGLIISSVIVALGLLVYGLLNRYQIASGQEVAYKLDKMSGRVWFIAVNKQIAVDEKIGKF